VDDNGVRRLLRVQLELLRQLHPDALGPEEAHDLGAILEIRARAVAQGVPRSPIAQFEEVLDVGRILGCGGHPARKYQFLADPPVPVFGERFGQLDG